LVHDQSEFTYRRFVNIVRINVIIFWWWSEKCLIQQFTFAGVILHGSTIWIVPGVLKGLDPCVNLIRWVAGSIVVEVPDICRG